MSYKTSVSAFIKFLTNFRKRRRKGKCSIPEKPGCLLATKNLFVSTKVLHFLLTVRDC